MKNRILIALIFIPLLVFIYLKGELLFLLFTNVIVGVSLYEFYGMMKASGREVALEYGVTIGMGLSVSMYLAEKGFLHNVEGYVVPICVFISMSLLIMRVLQKKIEGSTAYIGNTFLGLLYIPLLYLHIYGIR